MKILPEHYAEIKTRLASIAGKIPAHRENVRASGKFTDLEKRVRWDAANAALGSRWICDTLYPYANDTHIDTALRAAMRELSLSTA